jgi:transcriptional regulator with XRE-family HTH domain
MPRSAAILTTLKKVLKSRGVPYSKLAAELRLNETSVKRLMSGRTPMTLDRLDAICDRLGIDVFELARMSGTASQIEAPQLNPVQERALADDVFLFITFYGLAKGLTPAELIARYRINQSGMAGAIRRLRDLRMVESLSSGRVRLLVPKSIRWAIGGPLARKYEKEMERDFLGGAFAGAGEFRKFASIPLSDRSKSILIRKMREFVSEAHSQSEVDLALEKDLKNTWTMLIGLREWTPALLKPYLRRPSGLPSV